MKKSELNKKIREFGEKIKEYKKDIIKLGGAEFFNDKGEFINTKKNCANFHSFMSNPENVKDIKIGLYDLFRDYRFLIAEKFYDLDSPNCYTLTLSSSIGKLTQVQFTIKNLIDCLSAGYYKEHLDKATPHLFSWLMVFCFIFSSKFWENISDHENEIKEIKYSFKVSPENVSFLFYELFQEKPEWEDAFRENFPKEFEIYTETIGRC